MPSIINATTSTGLVSSADNSGSLQLATNNGTTAVTIDTSQRVGINATDPGTFSSGVAQAVIERTSAGNNTVPLALVNRSGTTNTSVSLDFNPNTNIALAQIRAFRTDASFGGGTDLRFLNYDGSALAERMRIDSSGRVTTPAQPAFMASLSGDIPSGTGAATIVFNATQTNIGSNYSTSTGRFTAPVAGMYQFNIVILVQGGSASLCDANLQVNGSNYKNGRLNAPDSTLNYACAIYLNANDYVSIYRGWTTRTTYGTSDWTYFSGFLIG